MSENDNQQPLATVFCKNGCGFYGSSQSDGLCSICFKKALKQRSQESGVDSTGAMGTIPSIIMHSTASSASLPAESTSADAAEAASVPEPPAQLLPPTATLAAVASEDSIASMNSSDASDSQQPSGSKRRNRCYVCKKKVGLTGFECRCGGVYCSLHRYSDKHDCQFDYQGHGQAEIRRANPVVVKSKVDKL